MNTSKSEAMVLEGDLPSLVGARGPVSRGGIQVSRRLGAASAGMRFVYQTVVVTLAFGLKSKLSICRLIYAPTLSYGHESWASWTEKTRLRMQVALHRMAGRSLRDRRIS